MSVRLNISPTPDLFPCSYKVKKPSENHLVRKRRELVRCRGLSGVDGFIILAGSITWYPPVSVAETFFPRRDSSEGQTQAMPGHPTGAARSWSLPMSYGKSFLKAKRQFAAARCLLWTDTSRVGLTQECTLPRKETIDSHFSFPEANNNIRGTGKR